MPKARVGQLRQWNDKASGEAIPGGIFLVLGRCPGWRPGGLMNAWDVLNLDRGNVDWHYQKFIETFSEVITEGGE